MRGHAARIKCLCSSAYLCPFTDLTVGHVRLAAWTKCFGQLPAFNVGAIVGVILHQATNGTRISIDSTGTILLQLMPNKQPARPSSSVANLNHRGSFDK